MSREKKGSSKEADKPWVDKWGNRRLGLAYVEGLNVEWLNSQPEALEPVKARVRLAAGGVKNWVVIRGKPPAGESL